MTNRRAGNDHVLNGHLERLKRTDGRALDYVPEALKGQVKKAAGME
jgi:hypothetical protein